MRDTEILKIKIQCSNVYFICDKRWSKVRLLIDTIIQFSILLNINKFNYSLFPYDTLLYSDI